ncbi:hypothetical protein F7725_005005 [Dissostichus mawsoni]|uniref:Uncharacterized protein n=1 Tax=Dissostichus mawsoni TaxID=36200 RepID=A0A7J5XKR1_DISMA|nr:hypothetical protein F7725_005005 [Dissostichus mawsoni]
MTDSSEFLDQDSEDTFNQWTFVSMISPQLRVWLLMKHQKKKKKKKKKGLMWRHFTLIREQNGTTANQKGGQQTNSSQFLHDSQWKLLSLSSGKTLRLRTHNADSLQDLGTHNADSLQDLRTHNAGSLQDLRTHNADSLQDLRTHNADLFPGCPEPLTEKVSLSYR